MRTSIALFPKNTLGSCVSFNPRIAFDTGVSMSPCVPLRPIDAGIASLANTSISFSPCYAGVALISSRAGITLRTRNTCIALGSCYAGISARASITLGAVSAGGTSIAFRPVSAGSPRITFRSGDPSISLCSGIALGSCGTRISLAALETGIPLRTSGSGDSGISLRPRIPFGAGYTSIPSDSRISLRARGTRFTLRAL